MKEHLYKSMVKNLMKKNNFLNLSWLLDQGQMTEDDFQVEIDTNSELYVIELNGEVTPELIVDINDILNDLNLHLNVDEVAELFSLDKESLLSILSEGENQNSTEESTDASNN